MMLRCDAPTLMVWRLSSFESPAARQWQPRAVLWRWAMFQMTSLARSPCRFYWTARSRRLSSSITRLTRCRWVTCYRLSRGVSPKAEDLSEPDWKPDHVVIDRRRVWMEEEISFQSDKSDSKKACDSYLNSVLPWNCRHLWFSMVWYDIVASGAHRYTNSAKIL